MNVLRILKKLIIKKSANNSVDKLYSGIARKYGLEQEYWLARRNGCSPQEALEDWDII